MNPENFVPPVPPNRRDRRANSKQRQGRQSHLTKDQCRALVAIHRQMSV